MAPSTRGTLAGPSARGRTRAPEACCAQCPVRPRCLPGGLEAVALAHFAALIEHREVSAAGTALYRAGDPVAIYAVRRGAVGVVRGDASARLVRVVLPGELAGLAEVGVPVHTGAARTLTPAAVCAIRDDWMALPEAPVLHANLRRAMARHLEQVDAASRYLTAHTARERLHGLHAALVTRLADPGTVVYALP